MDDIEFKKYLDGLDQELKKFILSDDWNKKVKKICSDFGIKDPTKITFIQNEVLFVIIGLQFVGYLPKKIEEIGISKIQAGPVSEAIARDVLFDVAEYLAPEPELAQLPDASKGLLSDHEEIIKNPLKQVNREPEIKKDVQMKAPEQKLGARSLKPEASLSWEDRKKRAEESLKKITPQPIKKYPGDSDPYREPI